MVKRFIPILCSVACLFALVSAQETPSDASLFKDADKINELGLNILKDISKKNHGNIAISPLSLRSVFLPIQKASAGDTLEQINHAMGHADDFNAIYDHYSHHPNINIANLIAIDQNIPLLPDFKQSVPDSWFQICDFKNNPQQEQQKLVQWVHRNTDGLISNMPPSGSVTQDTRMMILNTFVFNGKWQHPFLRDATKQEPFHMEQGDIDVQMMSTELRSFIRTGPMVSQIVRLPYKNTNISMLIVLPKEGQTLGRFLTSVEWSNLASHFMTNKDSIYWKINIKLPQFNIQNKSISLNSSLQNSGVTDLFSSQKANFSRMSPSGNLHCNSIFQQCLIEVNEAETIAVASSGTCIPISQTPPPKPEFIQIDRPFLWFIYDHEFDLILFCGTYTGPDE